MIRRTIFATDNESSRYALGGVKLEWKDNILTAVGTDGRRLAKMDGPAQAVGQPAPFGDVTVVPTRAMNLLERALGEDGSEVQLAVRQNDILVKNPRCTIYSRLLEGRYPRWRDVFPQRPTSNKIPLTVGPVHSAVRQAAIVTSEESRGIDFTFGDGSLVLAGQTAEVGQSRIELADRLRRPHDLDHARPALRERFPQSARTRKGVHDRPARQRRRRRLHDRRRLRLRDHAARPRSLTTPHNLTLLDDPQTAATDFLARRDREQRRYHARKPKSIGNVIAQLITVRGYGRIQADTNFAARLASQPSAKL